MHDVGRAALGWFAGGWGSGFGSGGGGDEWVRQPGAAAVAYAESAGSRDEAYGYASWRGGGAGVCAAAAEYGQAAAEGGPGNG